jgi:hypothetical protein
MGSDPASPRLRRDDLLLHVAQAILAEENLLANEEGGRAKGAARDGGLSVLEQRVLDRRLLDARQGAGTV